jgi:hypothetical protein
LAQIAAAYEIRVNLQSSEPPHKQNANQTLQIICLLFKSLLPKLDFSSQQSARALLQHGHTA